MDEPYSDSGTVIPTDTLAITVTRNGEVMLLVPKMGDQDEVPIPWLAASMVAVRLMQDPEWVEELAEDFKNKKRA